MNYVALNMIEYPLTVTQLSVIIKLRNRGRGMNGEKRDGGNFQARRLDPQPTQPTRADVYLRSTSPGREVQQTSLYRTGDTSIVMVPGRVTRQAQSKLATEQETEKASPSSLTNSVKPFCKLTPRCVYCTTLPIGCATMSIWLQEQGWLERECV